MTTIEQAERVYREFFDALAPTPRITPAKSKREPTPVHIVWPSGHVEHLDAASIDYDPATGWVITATEEA